MLTGMLFHRTDCNFLAISVPNFEGEWTVKNPPLNVNLFGLQPSRAPNLAKLSWQGCFANVLLANWNSGLGVDWWRSEARVGGVRLEREVVG